MVASESRQSKKKTSMGEHSHEHFLLLALSRAAQAIQRARTLEDFYLAVGREINLLGGEVTLLLLTEDRQSLSIAYTSYSQTLIRKAEKLTGLTLQEYRLLLAKGGIYERTLHGGTAVFLDSIFETMAEILPKALHPFIRPLMSVFNLRQGALVPLRVDDEVLGLLKVNGSFLSVADLPAMDSFAGHIAAGLYNVRLTQKLQDELTARKKAEFNLKEREAQYRLLAERVADVVWVLDMGTMKFKYVSPSIENLLGYTAEEMVGKSMDDFILPDSLVELQTQTPERVRRFLSGDLTAARQIDQVEQRHKDGSSVAVEISSTFVLNENSELEAIGVSRDITRRKQVEDMLRHTNLSLQTAHRELQQMFEHEQVLARTDGLTHLYNRRYFFELATREFISSKRYQRSLTIILFDIDGFKTANDTFGHALGDAILAQISQVTHLQIREVDILARYGGDEFTILLPETNSEQAFNTAERIRQSVEDTHIEAGNASISITLSLGVAQILHTQDSSIEDIIRRADKALYQAKQRGKNNTVIYSTS